MNIAEGNAVKKGKDWDRKVVSILNAYNEISKSINPTQLLKVDLTSSQIKVMVSFTDKDSFTMTELSQAHSVSVSTMTSMVDRLMQNELIERQRDERDRRIVRVGLTPKGKKMVKHLMKARRQELEKFLLELSRKEVDIFHQSIENVARFLGKAKKN